MYRLLFVDDEPIIWEGIQLHVDWNALNIIPSPAKNGNEAYDIIMRDTPDIIITDIRMPGMDGLELVKKVRQENKTMPFIILSGYDEFDYAQEAMKYGVQHYLLKPAIPKQIHRVLQEVTQEIEKARERENKQNRSRALLERVKPQLKEQFLLNSLIGHKNVYLEQDAVKELLGINNNVSYSFALFELDGSDTFQNAILLKEVTKELFQTSFHLGENEAFFIAAVGNGVLFMTKAMEYDALVSFVKSVQSEFSARFELSFTAGLALMANLNDIREVFNQLKQCTQYRFYLGDESIITTNEVLDTQIEAKSAYTYEYEQIALTAGSGNLEKIERLLQSCFITWQEKNLSARVLRFHCLELISHVINRTGYEPEATQSYVALMSDLSASPEAFLRLTRESIVSICTKKFETAQCKANDIVKCVLDYVRFNYHEEDLSLAWIAKKVVFLNSDYVGRLFKKQTGKNFNPYLRELRINHAKALFQNNPRYSITDVAQRVGLCKNPQYFSNLFKQYVGMTPRMYKLQYENTRGEAATERSS